MIDVHVLTHSGTRAEWLDECLESLRHEPCTVHVLQGTEGNIAAGRERGFALGAHPYVTYVDSDDVVLPGAMDAVLEGLQHHDAVTTYEAFLVDGEYHGRVPGHHLFALRREVLAPHLPGWGMRNRGRHCNQALVQVAHPHQLNTLGYGWRQHAGQSWRKVMLWKW